MYITYDVVPRPGANPTIAEVTSTTLTL
jgi:hypothetical protein